MTDAAAGVDDYKGLDVRGKIVVVLRGIPKGMDSEIAAHLLSEQIRIAVDHGAIGVVKIRDLARVKAFPWKDMLKRTNDPETTWVGKDGVPFDPGYGLKASALVEGEPAALLSVERRPWAAARAWCIDVPDRPYEAELYFLKS